MGKVEGGERERERSVPDGGCAEQVLESTVLLMSGVRLFADQQPAWPGQTVSAASHSSLRPARHHLAILCQETSNQPFFRKNCQDTQQPVTPSLQIA